MKNITNERIEMLKKAGFDVEAYDMKEFIILTPKELKKASEIVEDKQLDNKKLFRRWVTAQTFRMLDGVSYNNRTGKKEYGWDAYLRNRYVYHYQFTMMLDELKALAKMEKNDRDAFLERSKFFTKDVVIETCLDYLKKLNDYVEVYTYTHDDIRKTAYGSVTETCIYVNLPSEYYKWRIDDFKLNRIEPLKNLIGNMSVAKTYNELHILLKLFVDKMTKLPKYTQKCGVWKTAFKGIGAYETLKNLILFHGVTLKGYPTKDLSMERLYKCLEEFKGDYWKMHYVLKETVAWNDFNLARSINANK